MVSFIRSRTFRLYSAQFARNSFCYRCFHCSISQIICQPVLQKELLFAAFPTDFLQLQQKSKTIFVQNYHTGRRTPAPQSEIPRGRMKKAALQAAAAGETYRTEWSLTCF